MEILNNQALAAAPWAGGLYPGAGAAKISTSMSATLQKGSGSALGARYEVLIRVSQAISAHHDPRELFRILKDELRRVVTSDYVSFFLYDDMPKSICPRTLSLLDRPEVPVPSEITPEENAIWWVYHHQQPLLIPFVDQEIRFPRSMECVRKQGIQSVCALPLKTVHRTLGCLVCGSRYPDAYSEEEVCFLSLVADQVALAIDDALNFEALQVTHRELQSERDRLKLLLDLNNTVVSNLELRELLRAVSASVRQVMKCDSTGVALLESGTNQLRIYALDFPEGKGIVQEESLAPVEGTYAAGVLRTGEAVVFDGEALAQLHVSNSVAFEGIQSLCLLPLISRSRVLGVLGLGRLQEEPFSEVDVGFLKQVASQIAIAIENALAYGQIADLKDKLAQEKLYLEDEIRSELNFEEIVGASSALRHALSQVETVAPTDSTVLLLGETGTGKELVARAIHYHSRRRDRAFVKLNCAAIPTGLLESELFGHERGAFTGAVSQKIGRFELADQGTLFLDEVGDIPLELQPKLLRALQEREFERLGNTKTKKVDVRLVAATNRDLQKMVADNLFRSDLYYRLNVFPIRIPPLRERPEDIPMLVRHFTQKYARRLEKRIESIPARAMNRLRQWHWPGNVRELENVIERAVILTAGSVLNVPVSELSDGSSRVSATAGSSSERDQILRVLKETAGRVGGPNGAAARLGLKRTTLISRMKKLGITPAQVS
ncbi:MAG TPA: sigma 54-interacting transcriptional regulator [Acidobacteriota bacterium]|nr:sigma 54-interacting transcriptional regulator [Acidobacteriota bacterium]